MRAYNARAENYNPHVPPPVPELVWSFEDRLAMSQARCREEKRHAGRARRHRREVTSGNYLGFLAALSRGEGLQVNPDGFTYSIQAVLYAEIPDCPAWIEKKRAMVRGLLAQALKHGPASGWGVKQPPPKPGKAAKWTPYWVPKASEKCWRWWRWLVLSLMRMMTALAVGLLSLVPPRRLRLEAKPLEASAVESPARGPEPLQRCRDKGVESLGSILEWAMPRPGM